MPDELVILATAVLAVSSIIAVSLFKVITFGLAKIFVSLLPNIAFKVTPIPLKSTLPVAEMFSPELLSLPNSPLNGHMVLWTGPE